jgi:hypothetical protein
MNLTKRLHAAATDIYPDIYFVQEIIAGLVFLTVVSVAVIVTFFKIVRRRHSVNNITHPMSCFDQFLAKQQRSLSPCPR